MVIKKELEKLLNDSEGPKKPTHKEQLYACVTPLWTREMGERLKLMRMSLFLDQTALGQYLGVSQKVISEIETGRRREPARILLSHLETMFGDKLGYVLFGSAPERFNSRFIVYKYWELKRANQGNRLDNRFGVPKHVVLERAAERAVKAAQNARAEYEYYKPKVGRPKKGTTP